MERSIFSARFFRAPATVCACIELKLVARRENDEMVVDYELNTLPQNGLLNLALVERELKIDVPRGENAGRLLEHHNVVRVFQEIKPEVKGKSEIDLPDGVDLKNVSVIGYIQNRKTMKIVGAAEAVLTK